MSEIRKVRMLLAQMGGDKNPSVIAAIDEMIWELWSDEDEAAWVKRGKETWGIDYDTEFKIVVAEFALLALVEAFATPAIKGDVRA